jgi:MFS family permease
MAGVAAGLGPIIGGFLTSYASWRYAFAAEVVIVIWILLRRGLIKDVKLEGPTAKLDVGGVILSVAGLGTMVQGILLAST